MVAPMMVVPILAMIVLMAGTISVAETAEVTILVEMEVMEVTLGTSNGAHKAIFTDLSKRLHIYLYMVLQNKNSILGQIKTFRDYNCTLRLFQIHAPPSISGHPNSPTCCLVDADCDSSVDHVGSSVHTS